MKANDIIFLKKLQYNIMALKMLMDNNKNEILNGKIQYDEKEKEKGHGLRECDRAQKIGIQTNQVASICPCSA